jgi:hypothetical protein
MMNLEERVAVVTKQPRLNMLLNFVEVLFTMHKTVSEKDRESSLTSV